MLFYNISIPENCSNNCYDGILYSLLYSLKYEYEYYNILNFYTNYFDDDSKKIIFRKKNKIRENILFKFYGIEINYYTDKNEMSFEYVKNTLSYSPIGIFIDPYLCDWTLFYNKAHSIHILLIVGYENDNYICFDMLSKNKGYIKIKVDSINNNYIKYFIFKFKSKPIITKKMIIEQIHDIKKEYLNNCNYSIDFVCSKIKEINMDKVDLNNLETSSILINLSEIAEDRQNFIVFLKCISQKMKFNIHNQLYNLIYESKNNFLILKSLMLKYFMTGYINEVFLKNTIYNIMGLDKMIVNHLGEILKE